MDIRTLIRGVIIAVSVMLLLAASQRADEQAAEAERTAQHG